MLRNLESAPRTEFDDGIAYIRVNVGVAANEQELRAQIAHEIVHTLSKGKPSTVLEEGMCTYFAVKYGQAHPPHPDNPDQKKYHEAYAAATELLKRCPNIIKRLRAPRPIDEISADELRKCCPDYPGDFNHLASKF